MSKQRHSVETIITKLREAEVQQAKGDSIPDARRAFASELEKNGHPIRIISHLLGHKSIRTTERYLAIGRDEVARAVESVSIRNLSSPIDGSSNLATER